VIVFQLLSCSFPVKCGISKGEWIHKVDFKFDCVCSSSSSFHLGSDNPESLNELDDHRISEPSINGLPERGSSSNGPKTNSDPTGTEFSSLVLNFVRRSAAHWRNIRRGFFGPGKMSEETEKPSVLSVPSSYESRESPDESGQTSSPPGAILEKFGGKSPLMP
jgi:hypothetical protein